MNRDLILRLANLLEAALPYLDRAAQVERNREAGKAMRSVTAQNRAKAAREAVKEAFAVLEGGDA